MPPECASVSWVELCCPWWRNSGRWIILWVSWQELIKRAWQLNEVVWQHYFTLHCNFWPVKSVLLSRKCGRSCSRGYKRLDSHLQGIFTLITERWPRTVYLQLLENERRATVTMTFLQLKGCDFWATSLKALRVSSKNVLICFHRGQQQEQIDE